MPYSTFYAFDYVDSESESHFTLSRHNLIIFDCKYCKNAKLSKDFWPYMNVIIDTLIISRNIEFLQLIKIEESSI